MIMDPDTGKPLTEITADMNGKTVTLPLSTWMEKIIRERAAAAGKTPEEMIAYWREQERASVGK